MEFKTGVNLSIRQDDLQPNRWPSMLRRPAVTIDSFLSPIQSAWELPQIPVSSLSSAPASNLGEAPYGQPSPFPSAPVNGYSSALYCTEGGYTSQMPSSYTQLPGSSTASASFAQQSGVVGAHGLLNNGHSQTDRTSFAPRQTPHCTLKSHRQPMQRKVKRQDTTHKPVTILVYRKTHRPAAEFTSDLRELQARCLVDGGDSEAVGLLLRVFPQGISQDALLRPLTRTEAHRHTDGTSGQAYRMLLRVDGENRFRCKLCPVNADESGWKHARDALRHLKRDHFGLGNCCDKCGKLVYSAAEMTKHRCK